MFVGDVSDISCKMKRVNVYKIVISHARFYVKCDPIWSNIWQPGDAKMLQETVAFHKWLFHRSEFHDGGPVVACAKFCSNMIPDNGVTLKSNFHLIRITIKASFVRWTTGSGLFHYSDVIMGVTVSQTTGISIICSTVCSGAGQRKNQSSTSLAFVREIHRWPVDSPQNGQ